MVTVRPATLADIALIEPRQQDIDELWSAFRHTPQEALRVGIREGQSWIGFYRDIPMGVFGVNDYSNGVGCIWAIFTHEAERHPKAFLKACKQQLKAIQSGYDVLMNYVDERNTRVIQWLSWLGFKLHEPKPYGIEQRPFRLFEWRRNV